MRCWPRQDYVATISCTTSNSTMEVSPGRVRDVHESKNGAYSRLFVGHWGERGSYIRPSAMRATDTAPHEGRSAVQAVLAEHMYSAELHSVPVEPELQRLWLETLLLQVRHHVAYHPARHQLRACRPHLFEYLNACNPGVLHRKQPNQFPPRSNMAKGPYTRASVSAEAQQFTDSLKGTSSVLATDHFIHNDTHVPLARDRDVSKRGTVSHEVRCSRKSGLVLSSHGGRLKQAEERRSCCHTCLMQARKLGC